VLLLTFGASLLIFSAVMTLARGSIEPYYLEFNTPGTVNGGLDACRLLYFDRPQECGYLVRGGTLSLSPDGRWRAYIDGYNVINRVATGGSEPEQIMASSEFAVAGVPVWSSDGRWLAFAAFARGESDLDIVRVEVATGEITPLTDTPGDEWYPSWSADGQRIAFNARDPLGTTRLLTMRADGGDIQEPLPGLPQSFRPIWSADGATILFQSNCGVDVLLSLGEAPCAATHFDLYLLHLHEGRIEVLARLPGDDYDPAWSPNGEWIAFASRIDPASHATVFRVRPDGSDMQQITNDPNTDYFAPSWAKTPDFVWRPILLGMLGLVCVIVGARRRS
jgi:Tol biopolymer transport system component